MFGDGVGLAWEGSGDRGEVEGEAMFRIKRKWVASNRKEEGDDRVGKLGNEKEKQKWAIGSREGGSRGSRTEG